jgi:uncharacterized protein
MIARMRRARVVTPVVPAETGKFDGLAYSLWLPDGAPRGAVVILHGAASRQESHYDFARVLVANRLAAVAFDARGHGRSPEPMDGRALQDVATMAELARERCGRAIRVGLRGSSMGGYLALAGAAAAGASAVVAICPAGSDHLRRGLAAGRFDFPCEVEALDALLASHHLDDAVRELEAPVLLLHAEGDERVPVQHSRELAQGLYHPRSRLIVLPGGHHRSIQHDEELQGLSARFLAQALAAETA